jgi:tripartite-type tricarboxylate transporter receptor subunit TctC
LLAPARTPRDIVNKLHADIGKVLRLDDTREKLAREALHPSGIAPEQFSAMIQDEMVKMARIVKAANIKVD